MKKRPNAYVQIAAACALSLSVVAASPSPAPSTTGASPLPSPSASNAGALSIAGVRVGDQVTRLFKTLGPPDVAQTQDDGHYWQWASAGGLDREIVTDDSLAIKSVMVALSDAATTRSPSPRASGSPAPADAPLLGLSEPDALAAAAALGATGVERLPGPGILWSLHGCVMVAEFADGRVVRLRGIDLAYARALGYFGRPSPAPAAHRAPQLIRQILPPYVPPGKGTVIVRVSLDAAGKVIDTLVIFSSHDVAVDAFEQESMRLSKFAPAMCAGTPCPGVYIDNGGISRPW